MRTAGQRRRVPECSSDQQVMEVGLNRDLQEAEELGRVQRALRMEGAAGMHRADRAPWPRA